MSEPIIFKNETPTTVKLKVRVTERTTHDGRKFNSYCTFSKNGRRTTLKFRKEITNPPAKDCYIICNVDDVNINTSDEFPVCWVRAILDIEDMQTTDRERNAAAVADYFGE